MSGWDGAAGSVRPDAMGQPKRPTPEWAQAYYREVVLEDERRFLVSEALLHTKMVESGQVNGERRW